MHSRLFLSVSARTIAACALLAVQLAGSAAAARCGDVHFTVPARPIAHAPDALHHHDGFFLVPENRADPGSRCILVRYLRFPARVDTGGDLAPVVILPGGPGDRLDADAVSATPATRRTIGHITATRDVIILQQRGIRDGAHAFSPLMRMEALPLDRATDADDERLRLRTAMQAAIAEARTLGVDLRGYTVHEMVADLDHLADLLSLPKIVLYGTSFGSQWSLAYLKLHGDRVERAVLTGVEPLDHAYDSPDWLWHAYARIDAAAMADPAVTAAFGEEGLMAAYKRILERLRSRPQRMAIRDARGVDVDIVVGAHDLQQALPSPVRGDRRRNLAALPQFLRELDRGDYRYLAALAYQRRQTRDAPMLWLLVDNALGISSRRDGIVGTEAAAQWLGEVNAAYRDSRDLTPTADVGDAFRSDFPIPVPVLMIHGDMDLSTPLENAESQLPTLGRHGHLLRVAGGTHAVRNELLDPDAPPAATAAATLLLEFLSPSPGTNPLDVLSRVPAQVDAAPVDYGPADESLYDRWLRQGS